MVESKKQGDVGAPLLRSGGPRSGLGLWPRAASALCRGSGGSGRHRVPTRPPFRPGARQRESIQSIASFCANRHSQQMRQCSLLVKNYREIASRSLSRARNDTLLFLFQFSGLNFSTPQLLNLSTALHGCRHSNVWSCSCFVKAATREGGWVRTTGVKKNKGTS
jgi:hypothetical protein